MTPGSDEPGYQMLWRVCGWPNTRRIAAGLLWVLTIGVGLYLFGHSRGWYADPSHTPEERRRPDGVGGYTQIDFGGQWIMGRMLVSGHGRELYHRQRQWEVVRAGYPVDRETLLQQTESILPPSQRRMALADEELQHDADWLMSWVIGNDPPEWRVVGGAIAAALTFDTPTNPFRAIAIQQSAADAVTPALVEKLNEPAIGGPLYPPVHAFLYAPLATDDRPQRSFLIVQILVGVLVLIAGLGVKVLTGGRVWWSVASLVIFLYPGTRAAFDLGQNPTLTLAIVVWGWALAVRGYNFAGGMVWGLLAYKPVWGLAFFLVPLLMRRWRFCAAMVLTGGGLVVATIPVVGLQTWFDWLKVGAEASRMYNINRNWINLSRDLHGIPRRVLHDFSQPEAVRDTPLAQRLAWGLWGTILATTAGVYLIWGDRRRATGIGAAFLFFGAYQTCYRFMYYDAMLSAVGFAVLLTTPARFLRTRLFIFSPRPQEPLPVRGRELTTSVDPPAPFGPRLVGYVSSFPLSVLMFLLLLENSLNGMQLQATFGLGYYAQTVTTPDRTTSAVTPRVEVSTSTDYPWETAAVLAVWAWCGWRLLRGDERNEPPEPVALSGGS